MKTAKDGRKTRAGRRKVRVAKAASRVGINPVVLPNEELRRLVSQIVLRDDIKPFLRRMVILLDGLKAGQTSKVAQVARQSKDLAFVKLMSALSEAVEGGELVAAHITVFLAASYAYQESLDYCRELMGYLDRFREGAGEQSRNGPHPTRASSCAA